MQQNNNDLRIYRVWQRFTILQVMGGLALLGVSVTILFKIF